MTTLVVNVPAAWHGTSLYTIAISLTFAFFTPAAIPAALKPFGAVTPPSITVILICLPQSKRLPSFYLCWMFPSFFHSIGIVSVHVLAFIFHLPHCTNPYRCKSVIFSRIYGNIGTCFSPSSSSKPNSRFMFCTACPAAPLTRLSSAPIMIIRPVRGSILKLIST